jgi:hypothetical protein
MNEAIKQIYVNHVVNIYKELVQQESNQIYDVNRTYLSKNWMKPPKAPNDYSPKELLVYYKEIEMDYTSLVLHYYDIGPTNVIVNYTKGCTVGIIN